MKEKEILEKIKKATKAFRDWQILRIATENRYREYGIKRSPFLKELRRLEKEAKKKVEELTLKLPEGRKLSEINGIGSLSAGILLANLKGKSWPTLSQLKKYSGWVPREVRKGKYNHKLHAFLANVCFNLWLHNQYYRSFYEKRLTEILKIHPEWAQMRKRPAGKTKAENAAFQQLVQKFLKDLWLNVLR